MSTPTVAHMADRRKAAPLDDQGVMLATCCLQLQLYRVLGESLDRQAAYQLTTLVVQEYFRGQARHAGQEVR